MLQITDKDQQREARLVKEAYATYRANRDLIAIGAYRQGSDPKIDIAIQHQDAIRRLIEQPIDESADFQSSVAALAEMTAAMQVSRAVDAGSQQSGSATLMPIQR